MLTFSREEVQLKTIKIFLNHIFILLNSISSLVFSSISTDFSFFFLTGLSNVDLFKKRSVTRNWNSLFCAQSSTITESAATLKLSPKILFAPILKPGNFLKKHLAYVGSKLVKVGNLGVKTPGKSWDWPTTYRGPTLTKQILRLPY